MYELLMDDNGVGLINVPIARCIAHTSHTMLKACAY